mgnify:CR=1 FL=1
MENENNFKLILEKYYQKEISDDETRTLFQALKDQKTPFSKQQKNHTSAEENTVSSKPTEIAIIGMAGQFPDADNSDVFWQNLLQRHDAVYELHLDQSLSIGSPGKRSL